MIAAIRGKFMLMKLLIESGVDIERTNKQGLTLPMLIKQYHNVTLGEAIAVRDCSLSELLLVVVKVHLLLWPYYTIVCCAGCDYGDCHAKGRIYH